MDYYGNKVLGSQSLHGLKAFASCHLSKRGIHSILRVKGGVKAKVKAKVNAKNKKQKEDDSEEEYDSEEADVSEDEDNEYYAKKALKRTMYSWSMKA